MFTEKDLKAQVPAPILALARVYLDSSGAPFQTLTCRYDGDLMMLVGSGANEYGDQAHVSAVVVDLYSGRIRDGACMHANHDGLCVHTVALLVLYLRNPRMFEGYSHLRAGMLPRLREAVHASSPAAVAQAAENLLEASRPKRAMRSFGSSLDWVRDHRQAISFYFDAEKSGRIWCEPRYARDGRTGSLFCMSPAYMTSDDLVNMKRAQALFERFGFQEVAEENASFRQLDCDPDQAVAFAASGVRKFRALGDVMVTDRFANLGHARPARIDVGVSVESGLLNFAVSSDEVPENEIASVLASYRKRRRYHRLRDGSLLDLEDEALASDLALLNQTASNLDLDERDLAHGGAALPAARSLLLHPGDALRDDDGSVARFLEGVNAADPSAYQVPAGFAGTLRPYQEEGFKWLCSRMDNGLGGAILADQMGLGKTAQSIAVILDRAERARERGERACALVVCPSSLVKNWEAEFSQFAPGLDVVLAAGAKQLRQGYIAHAASHDVLVTSYDALWRDIDAYEGLRFSVAVLDEANRIKNPHTKAAQAAKRLQAQGRIALSGTPVENRLSELYSIMEFCVPGLLAKSYERFRTRFERPIVRGNEEAASQLRSLVRTFVIRRLATEVLDDLPDKVEVVARVKLTGEQSRLYHAREQRLRNALAEGDLGDIELLAEITRLRQVCCDPSLVYENYHAGAAKLDAIMELVAQAHDEGVKAVVFSQWTSFLERISARLAEGDVDHDWITGDTPVAKRLDIVNAFNGNDMPVLLVSMRAGGVGLNMTGASLAILADPFWHDAAQAQAYSRLWRIGQRSTVVVCKVIAEQTIEERILGLQDKKLELADRVISQGAAYMPSRDEIAALVLGEPSADPRGDCGPADASQPCEEPGRDEEWEKAIDVPEGSGASGETADAVSALRWVETPRCDQGFRLVS